MKLLRKIFLLLFGQSYSMHPNLLKTEVVNIENDFLFVGKCFQFVGNKIQEGINEQSNIISKKVLSAISNRK